MKFRIFLPILLLCAATASAEPECLSGELAVDDRRALAALREAVELACPCESFKAPNVSRRLPYRRCARAVLGDALATENLRPECRDIALDTYLGATCGSNRQVCAERRVSPEGTQVACQTRKPNHCNSDRNVTRTACASLTHCADAAPWTAGTCIDVRDDGPFAVGVHRMPLRKPGFLDDTVERVLDPVVWFPATAAHGTFDPDLGGFVDADIHPSGPHPTFFFSHGACSLGELQVYPARMLASYGFVVVAPNHPGSMQDDCNKGLEFLIPNALERMADMSFALDGMLAAHEDPASPFFGAVDGERAGIGGGSFGGTTTHLVASQDPRFRAALPVVPGIIPFVENLIPAFSIPSLTLMAGDDRVVPNARTRVKFQDSVAPKYLVEVERAGHIAFQNECIPRPILGCNPPISLSLEESQPIATRWILPFLKVHLAGDLRFEPFLSTPPQPGVTLDAVH